MNGAAACPTLPGMRPPAAFSEPSLQAIGELGRIVSEAGAARSTLTLFASDNGPWVEMAPAAGSAGPLRGGKFTTYEGGIRVPALAHLPGAVPAGRVTAAVASLLDVLPTAVRLAGGTPRAQLLDGRDLRPLLSGRSEVSPPQRPLGGTRALS